MTTGKTAPIEKDSQKTNHPQKLQTHSVPTNDVENSNDTNQVGDLLFAYKPRTKKRFQGDQRRSTIHCLTHDVDEPQKNIK